VKLTLEQTPDIVELNGVPARIWIGQTESGVRVHAFIAAIAIEETADAALFAAQLQSVPIPEFMQVRDES
jgi:hypothetical protein